MPSEKPRLSAARDTWGTGFAPVPRFVTAPGNLQPKARHPVVDQRAVKTSGVVLDPIIRKPPDQNMVNETAGGIVAPDNSRSVFAFKRPRKSRWARQPKLKRRGSKNQAETSTEKQLDRLKMSGLHFFRARSISLTILTTSAVLYGF